MNGLAKLDPYNPEETTLDILSRELHLPHQIWGQAAGLGNGVLSRYPIKDCENIDIVEKGFERRNCILAIIEYPPSNLIGIMATHLEHTNESARVKQLNQIFHHIEPIQQKYKKKHRKELPILFLGDFNAFDRKHYSEKHGIEISEVFYARGWRMPKVPIVINLMKEAGWIDVKTAYGSSLTNLSVEKECETDPDSHTDLNQCTVWVGEPLLRIDYMWMNTSWNEMWGIKNYRVCQEIPHSDHFPIFACFNIRAIPDQHKNESSLNT
eukprot:TRINITY_DN20483_c0_g1_i1.p1 TRINITY_DN20483_c0_g1~~TRINITY_DN20483_c0_g1_i1.p1  ORF type:complete len:307 (-),score=44.58 TRINITY_DN20483_c0_g1_i1:30-830(-)